MWNITLSQKLTSYIAGIYSNTNKLLARICLLKLRQNRKHNISSRSSRLFLVTEILNIECHVSNYPEMLFFFSMKWDLTKNESKVKLKTFFSLLDVWYWEKLEDQQSRQVMKKNDNEEKKQSRRRKTWTWNYACNTQRNSN